MRTDHKIGYAFGFVAAFLLMAYGFFPSYDQVRLGLAALGTAVMIALVIAWADHGLTEDSIANMDVVKLGKLRPDLMIAQKTNDPPKNCLPEQRPEPEPGPPAPDDPLKKIRFDEHGNLA